MKTFPILALLSLLGATASSAQAGYNQDLSKYSYPIFTVTNKQQFTGTAFFYRSGDTSFLVSNYHAIKGMSPMRKAINFDADTLYLKYPLRNSHDVKVMAINISEEITGKTEIFSMIDRIDLLKVAVTTPPDADIMYINDLIDVAYLDDQPEAVLVFGFPTKQGSVPPFYSRQQRLEGKVNPDGFTDYDASLQLNFPPVSDSARAIMSGTSRYYYFIKPYAAQGYSGAPVIGKFRNASNEIVYRFMGVVFAGQPTTRQTWAIKGDVALQYLRDGL
jgi:hypothetical protein